MMQQPPDNSQKILNVSGTGCAGNMIYTPSEKDFFNQLKENPKGKIQGILLYTKEDEDLKNYIEEYSQEFHNMTGDWSEIYILEKPSKEWREKNLSFFERMKFMFIPKIDKSEPYRIAKRLKIDIYHIPCLVLFGKDVNSQRLIFPIKAVSRKDLPGYFRELFSNIEKILFDEFKDKGRLPFDAFSYYFEDIKNYLNELSSKKVSQISSIPYKDETKTVVVQYVIQLVYIEIQQIIDELAKSPTSPNDDTVATEAIKEKIKANPTLKQRLISALKQGGTEALKAIFDHPIVHISVEAIKGFLEPT
jgi:hypothetical protein